MRTYTHTHARAHAHTHTPGCSTCAAGTRHTSAAVGRWQGRHKRRTSPSCANQIGSSLTTCGEWVLCVKGVLGARITAGYTEQDYDHPTDGPVTHMRGACACAGATTILLGQVPGGKNGIDDVIVVPLSKKKTLRCVSIVRNLRSAGWCCLPRGWLARPPWCLCPPHAHEMVRHYMRK